MTEIDSDIEDRDANVRLVVSTIISDAWDAMYEKFDRLHKRNIHDDDVVRALRSLGENELLEHYADWAEIDLREDDNTTMNPAVPDPGDAPSYKDMGTVKSLTEELTDAGINADNLEQAILDAVAAGKTKESTEAVLKFGPSHPDHPDHEHEDCCK